MARPKKGEPSKSASIRAYKKQHPSAKAGDIVEALKSLKISPAHVYNALATEGGKKKKKKSKAGTNGYASVLDFIKSQGGLDKAQAKVNEVAEIAAAVG